MLHVRGDSVTTTVAAGGEGGAEQQSAARAVDVVAQMVEYIRGSRVDDYAPLFALSARFSETASSAAEGGVRPTLYCPPPPVLLRNDPAQKVIPLIRMRVPTQTMSKYFTLLPCVAWGQHV